MLQTQPIVALATHKQVWTGAGSSWCVSKSGSPGNLGDFRDTATAQGSDDTVTMLAAMVDCPRCIVAGSQTSQFLRHYQVQRSGGEVSVGIAVANTVFRSLDVYQFMDFGNFDVIESVAVQANAKECIVVNGECCLTAWRS